MGQTKNNLTTAQRTILRNAVHALLRGRSTNDFALTTAQVAAAMQTLPFVVTRWNVCTVLDELPNDLAQRVQRRKDHNTTRTKTPDDHRTMLDKPAELFKTAEAIGTAVVTAQQQERPTQITPATPDSLRLRHPLANIPANLHHVQTAIEAAVEELTRTATLNAIRAVILAFRFELDMTSEQANRLEQRIRYALSL